MRICVWASRLPLALLIALASCSDPPKKAGSCDLAAPSCAQGELCREVRPGQAECVPACMLAAATPSCAGDRACVPSGDSAACLPKCDPTKADACGAWKCVPLGDRGTVCRPPCVLTAPASMCGTGEVCQPQDDGSAACVTVCDPLDPMSCPGDDSCERRTDGVRSCYDPVKITGRVFDLASGTGIAQARVAAADQTGGAATNVALSDMLGAYSLTVPVERNPDGTIATSGQQFTLRAAASDYEVFPRGVRVALPIDAKLAARSPGQWVIDNATTKIGLLQLPAARRGTPSITGRIVAASPGGALVVAEGGMGLPPIAFSDASGAFVLFNVPVGALTVRAYRGGLAVEPAMVTVAAQPLTGVDLVERAPATTGTVSGSINIVNGGPCSATSVVLVPESTFDATLIRGEIAPGLRAPAPPAAPSVSGAFSIAGVPDGKYVVLAAFENDGCVRDPDPGISGTQVVHIASPAADGSRTIALPSSFKVTGALEILGPGATEPEAVMGSPMLRWRDDSSEDGYAVVVYDAFGTEVWRNDAVPSVSGGGEVTVPYAGPALAAGMYYQFRATSMRRRGPISQTEDLRGVFYVPSP